MSWSVIDAATSIQPKQSARSTDSGQGHAGPPGGLLVAADPQRPGVGVVGEQPLREVGLGW